jgi:hypothetical protein
MTCLSPAIGDNKTVRGTSKTKAMAKDDNDDGHDDIILKF